jgi:ABC-type dipeptide/oligopeptide/nickel transport system ATPase component
VAIVGPSGCGKSTILNMIGGLVAPSAGTVEIDGVRVAGRVPGNVGDVFEKDTVFAWRTVARNIAVGLEYRGVARTEQARRGRDAIALAGLEGFEDKIVLAWTIVLFIVFFNASDRQVMRTVIAPSALAWTFASLTPSISFALIGVVVGEFLGGESGGGLGYLIIQSLGTLNAADMMVALISLGVIGIVMALAIKQLEMRLLRWRPEYRGRA